MIELNFDNASLRTEDDVYIYNQSFYYKETIKVDSSAIIFGDVESEDSIVANYSLNVSKNIKADNIFIGNDLICYGNIICNNLEVSGDLNCYGEVIIKKSGEIQGSAIINSAVINNLSVSGDLIASDSLEIDGLCSVEGMVVSTDGILGAGNITCDKIEAKEYLEINCKANICSANETSKIDEVKLSKMQLKEIVEDPQVNTFIINKDLINNVLKDVIRRSEEVYDIDDLLCLLSDCSSIDEEYNEYLDILSLVVDSDELCNGNDLEKLLELTFILEKIPECMEEYNICKDLKEKKYKSMRNKVMHMNFRSIESHGDLIKNLNYMEELRHVFTKDENEYIYKKLYEKIGINSKLVFSKLKQR